MTGSVGDAEDIVQDAFLGLTRARRAGTAVANQKAYLTTAVTRLGINYLRSARVRRETYVGDWLPEPVVLPTARAGGPGGRAGRVRWRSALADRDAPAEHAELADSLSMAFLVLLEALSPVERAVFMLREVFGYGYPDIARITGKTEVNCRQIFTRARQRVTAGGPVARRRAGGRGPAGRRRGTRPPVLRGRRGRRHGRAAQPARAGRGLPRGRRRQGAGGRPAAGRPAAGRPADRRPVPPGRDGRRPVRPAWVNGQPGAVTYDAAGRVVNVFALDIADGQVQAIRSVVNPDKLGHLGPVSDLARLPDKER